MRLIKKKIIVVILIGVAGFIGYFSWHTSLKYLPAEERLNAEFAAFNLPQEFKLQNSTFVSGSCFDNCPRLKKVFTVNGTREQYGKILKQRLESRGFDVDYIAGHVFTGTTNDIRVYSVSKPELNTGTRDYETNLQQQNQAITEITLNLEYVP